MPAGRPTKYRDDSVMMKFDLDRAERTLSFCERLIGAMRDCDELRQELLCSEVEKERENLRNKVKSEA